MLCFHLPHASEGQQIFQKEYYAGRGWSIKGISSITRIGKNFYNDGVRNGITLTSSDPFSLDGNRLIPDGSDYRLEYDNLSLIKFKNGYFEVETKEGLIMEYGSSNDAKLILNNNVVLGYYLSKIIDQHGNYIIYNYNNNDGEITLKEIKYTGNYSAGILPFNTMKFYYDKSNEKTKYLLNNTLKNSLLLREIEVFSESVFVKKYDFLYGTGFSQYYLKEIIETGSDLKKLNSTLLGYGSLGSTSYEFLLGFNMMADFRIGDFNGDGLSDLLAFNYNTVNHATGAKNYFEYNLFLNEGDGTTYSWAVTQPINFNPYSFYDYFGFHPQPNIDAIDINADGLDDMVITQASGSTNYLYVYLSNGTGFNTPIQIAYFDAAAKYTFADINGDRKPELILFDPGLPGFWVINPLTGTSYACPPCDNVMTHPSLSIGSGLNYGGLSAIDFDGDGRQEIIASRQNNTVVLKFDNNIEPNGTGLITNVSEIYIEAHNQYHQYFYADYNGDGITDIARVHFTGTNAAKIRFGTGTGYTIEKVINDSPPTGEKVKYLTADVDFDGITDLIYLKYTPPKYIDYILYPGFMEIKGLVNIGSISGIIGLQLIANIGNIGFPPIRDYFLEQVYSIDPITFEDNPNKIPEFLVGDFNGDSSPDIFFKGEYYSERYIAYLNKNSTQHLLTNITDGFRRNINFKYKTLANGGPDVSVKGSGATYPLNDFKGAMFVVSEISIPDGIGGLNTTFYKYEGAKMHLYTKGFIGFKKVMASNLLTNRKVINEKTFDYSNPSSESNNYFELLPYKTQIHELNSGNLLYEKTTKATFINYANKRHIVKMDEELEADHITGKNVVTNMSYNADGIMESKIVNVQNGYEITEEYYSIETATNGSWIKWKPENVLIKNTRTFPNIEPVYIRETAYEYNSKGQVIKKTTDPNTIHPTIKPIVTNYTYNNTSGTGTGLLEKEQINSLGLASKESEYFYDTKHRFVIKAKNPKGQFSEAAYDPKWGKPKWEKSVDGLITQYFFDGFGRTTKIRTPDNLETNISYNWIEGVISGGDPVDISHALYSVTTQRSGTATIKVLYDALNRALRSETDGLVNKIYTAKEYDERLRIYKETGNYELNSTSLYIPVVTTYTYNDFDNITTISTTDGTVTNNTTKSYTYSNGNTTVTTVTPDSRTIYKGTDPTGLLFASSDDGGLIQYDFYSNRKLKTVTIGGVEISKIEYDDWARQKNLEDKNTGLTNYLYNAYGELIYQIDADNKWYNFSYDELGRLVSKAGIEGTYNYEYVESGNGLNKLKKITGPNYISYNYTYDNLGRLKETDEIIDGQNFVTGYQYDQNSNVVKKRFPGNFAIENEYDTKGFHKKIKKAGSAEVIWQLEEINPLGQITKYTLGNNIQTVNTFTHFGLPMSFVAGNVQNLVMEFNPQNSSLDSRLDFTKNGIKEVFEYDPQDRLLKSQVIGLNAINTTFASNGNITSKTGIGTYTYDGVKVNAVISVTNTGGLISTEVQDITYTNFKKAETITEGNFEYNITYGPDYDRKKAQLKDQGTVSYTRYYIGDYEKTITGTDVSEVYYIGYGAMYVFENGTGSMYYSYTDHLGSVLTVTDASGNIVAEQNFDAWGRKRNPSDWSYDNLPSVPVWLYRGFTGHEHLPEFGLINMNGRMYDPLIGRMLSPDNFVQFADYTQNFNRYSYAFNNPLKYTDPTGHTIEKFFRELINFIFTPFRLVTSPLNWLSDKVARKSYADNNFNIWYLSGHQPLYYSSGVPLAYQGSTAFSNAHGLHGGHMPFIDASGEAWSMDDLFQQAENARYIRTMTKQNYIPPKTMPQDKEPILIASKDGCCPGDCCPNLGPKEKTEAFDGFWGKVDWIMNGGVDGFGQYNWNGELIRTAPIGGMAPNPSFKGLRVLQTGGQILKPSTLKALKLTKEQGREAIHALKSDLRLPNNAHGIIMSNGDYIYKNKLIGNLIDYFK